MLAGRYHLLDGGRQLFITAFPPKRLVPSLHTKAHHTELEERRWK